MSCGLTVIHMLCKACPLRQGEAARDGDRVKLLLRERKSCQKIKKQQQ